jgi:hypothetical protein
MMMFIWVVTSCRLVGRYRRFGDVYLHLRDSMFLQNVGVHAVSQPFSESTYESTWRHSSEEHRRHYHRENHKFHGRAVANSAACRFAKIACTGFHFWWRGDVSKNHLNITPWSRVLIEKLIVAQPVKFLVFYGTRRFISVVIRTRY